MKSTERDENFAGHTFGKSFGGWPKQSGPKTSRQNVQHDPVLLQNRAVHIKKLAVGHVLSASIMSDLALIEKQKDMVLQKSMLSILSDWLDAQSTKFTKISSQKAGKLISIDASNESESAYSISKPSISSPSVHSNSLLVSPDKQ